MFMFDKLIREAVTVISIDNCRGAALARPDVTYVLHRACKQCRVRPMQVRVRPPAGFPGYESAPSDPAGDKNYFRGPGAGDLQACEASSAGPPGLPNSSLRQPFRQILMACLTYRWRLPALG